MNLQKIVSKRLVGELPVGDMEVNHGSHTYLLNGVNIHNSTIVNVVMASSCPSNCSFCKEALIARSYAESNIYETSGEITLHWDGKTQSFPAKTKVKFFDPNVNSIVYGPLQVPLGLGYPLADESIRKLMDGTLTRMLAD